MITKETAAMAWECHREINVAKELLNDMVKLEKEYRFKPDEQKLKDAFGRRRDLQLGIPSGENAHRLFNVSPSLAKAVIRAHVSNKEAELVEINEQIKIEMGI